MALAHPVLGVGPGNWPVIYPKFAPANDPSLSDATGMTSNPWPSSDWVAALSERGVLAFLALVAFVLMLLRGALTARYDAGREPHERLAALAGGGIVLIAALEGAFDAVLLLPTPSIVVWAAAGALLTSRSETSDAPRLTARRLVLAGAFAAFTYLACAFSGRRIQAMRLVRSGGPVTIEAAVARKTRVHTGFKMRAADYFVQRARTVRESVYCTRWSARDLFPYWLTGTAARALAVPGADEHARGTRPSVRWRRSRFEVRRHPA